MNKSRKPQLQCTPEIQQSIVSQKFQYAFCLPVIAISLFSLAKNEKVHIPKSRDFTICYLLAGDFSLNLHTLSGIRLNNNYARYLGSDNHSQRTLTRHIPYYDTT